MSISVVIPAYNSARYIAATLDSVFSQTLVPDEVLVVDDGSTDDTVSIAESFGPRVRVICQDRAGCAASRNVGVQEAKGEWIAFVDADDLWEPRKIELQMAELAKRPQADVCYTGRILLFQEGESTRLGKIIKVANPLKIRQALYRNTNFLPSAVIVRRKVFLDVGGFDTTMSHVSDWDLWLRLLHAGAKFAAIREPLVQYRIHPMSLTHNALVAKAAKDDVFRRLVLPYLPWSTRWIRHARSRSGHMSSAAFIMRRAGDSRCLGMMAKSLLLGPFHQPHRYKVLAHMACVRLLDRFAPKSSVSRQAIEKHSTFVASLKVY